MAACKQPPLPPESVDEIDEVTRETRWKRFHPFRVVRKIFRRRVKRESDASKKSWSTSELQSVQEDDIRKPEVTSALKIGFSVSHDSIFSPEGNANAIGGEALSISPGSSLSINHTTIKNMFKDELFSTIHVRRDLDDDDASYHNLSTSPTTMESVYPDLKEKSPQATYSSSSLTRIETSETYENASERSIKKSRTTLVDRQLLNPGDVNLSQSVPLNHKAALHKIAVKPKRTHGLPYRRKKQVAAAKEHASLSIPEIKEDVNKSINVVEVSKTFTELAASSKQISISSHSSEWQVSSISYKEELDKNRQSLIEEKSTISTQISKELFEGNSKSFNDEVTKGFAGDGLILKAENQLHFASNGDGEACKSKLINYESFMDSSIDIGKDSSITIIEDFSQIQHNSTIEINESSQENVPALKISSVLKNLKTNDTSKSSEKKHSIKEDLKYAPNKSIDNDDANFMFHKNNSTEKVVESNIKDDYLHKNNLNELPEPHSSNNSNMKTQEMNKGIKTSNISDVDIAMKPTKEPIFKDEQPMTSLFFEEESVMSTMSVKESGIYVSHHSSVQGDFNNVTEAHNFAAVEEVLNQASGSKCEPWISSVDILAPGKRDADVTVNSVTSTMCGNNTKEDKITISVNSKSEKLKSTISSHEKFDKQTLPDQTSINISKPAIQQPTFKEKQPLKTTHKHSVQENNSNNISTRNVNMQKRVSVEIVPFSQRMKERKYQPISFVNKDSSEPNKSSGVAVEKKNTDQKISTNKETSKSNNWNDLTKSSEKGEFAIEKKNIKTEKLQCPVQIRIHKSKPNSDSKDKSLHTTTSKKEFENPIDKPASTEVKFSAQSLKDKQGPTEGKLPAQTSKDKLGSTERKFPAQTSKDKLGSAEGKFSAQSAKDKIASTEAKFMAQSSKEKLPPTEGKFSAQSSKNKPSSTEVKFPTQSTKDNLSSTEVKFLAKSSKDKPVSTEVKISAHSSKVSQSDVVLLKEESKIEECSTKWETQQTFPVCKNSQLNIDNENELLSETSLNISSTPDAENEMSDPNCRPPSFSEDPEPELLRVFARRSIKQKHCDKDKTPEHKERNEENNDVTVSPNGTVIQISETSKPHITKHELKKKSKSFCEKTTRAVSPLKEMNLIPGETLPKFVAESPIETVHPRQRLASVSDVPLPQRTPPPVKEELLGLDEPPSWLQLAQQRREMREQRERLLLGGSPNSFMDPSNKPTRSSKVWDMVNNFQKLQMT